MVSSKVLSHFITSPSAEPNASSSAVVPGQPQSGRAQKLSCLVPATETRLRGKEIVNVRGKSKDSHSYDGSYDDDDDDESSQPDDGLLYGSHMVSEISDQSSLMGDIPNILEGPVTKPEAELEHVGSGFADVLDRNDVPSDDSDYLTVR